MIITHIHPLNDLKEHTLSEDCECKPSIEKQGERIYILHKAYDKREFQKIDYKEHPDKLFKWTRVE